MIDYTELVAIVSNGGGASRAARQPSSKKKKSFPFSISCPLHAHMGRIQPVYWLPVWKNTPQATNFKECFLTCTYTSTASLFKQMLKKTENYTKFKKTPLSSHIGACVCINFVYGPLFLACMWQTPACAAHESVDWGSHCHPQHTQKHYATV